MPGSFCPRLTPARRAASVVLGCAAAITQMAGAEELRVNVLGLQSDQGKAVAKLYREGEDIFKLPGLQQTAPISACRATLVFKDVAPGRYALIVFHDINANGQLDHNLVRLPAEPLGYSNGFQPGLLSGMPDSRKLAFTLGTQDLSLDIAIK